MKKLKANQMTYQCDACKKAPVNSVQLPIGWKSIQLSVRNSQKGVSPLQQADFCPACSESAGNSAILGVVGKLLAKN